MTASSVSSAAPRAAFLMILSCLCFSVMSASARYLITVEHIPPNYVIFIRNVGALVLLLPFCAFYIRPIMDTTRKRALTLRAVLGSVGMICWYNALAYGELAQVTAVGFAAPLLATVLAIIVFKEKVSYRRWSALAAGFIGIAVILGPDVFSASAASAQRGMLLALGTAFIWGVVALFLKSLSGSESIAVILFYMMAVMALCAIPSGYVYYTPISTRAAIITTGMCAAALLWQYFMLTAYKQSSVAGLQPFEFFKLLFAVAIGYMMFDESVRASTVIGGTIVAASAVYITYRERVLHKKDPSEPAL